jgi:hypothetical protein
MAAMKADLAAMETEMETRPMTPGADPAAAAADESKGLPEDKIDDPYWKEEDEEDPDAPLPAELGTLVSAATHAACETVSNPHLILT